MRHVNHPGTVARNQHPVPVSGPPLTWENDGVNRTGSDGSGGSARRNAASSSSSSSSTSNTSSLTAKGELPPLPATPKSYDQQATVRNMPSSGNRADLKIKHKAPSDEFEDYGEDFLGTYSQSTIQQKIAPRPVEDDIPDTTMLDSVILPAIASVSFYYSFHSLADSDIFHSFSSFHESLHRRHASHSVHYNGPLLRPRESFPVLLWNWSTRLWTLSNMWRTLDRLSIQSVSCVFKDVFHFLRVACCSSLRCPTFPCIDLPSLALHLWLYTILRMIYSIY